jgi:hypothetical protein
VKLCGNAKGLQGHHSASFVICLVRRQALIVRLLFVVLELEGDPRAAPVENRIQNGGSSISAVANLPSPDRETASAVRAFLTYSIIIARERIEHRPWFWFSLKLEH